MYIFYHTEDKYIVYLVLGISLIDIYNYSLIIYILMLWNCGK